MPNVTRTVVLTGARAGQTCTLNHGRFRFKNGKLVLRGDGTKVARMMRILANQYQAFELGSDELEAASGQRDLPEAEEHQDEEPALQRRIQPGREGTPSPSAEQRGGADGTGQGEAGVLPPWNGHADPRVDRIRKALTKLDHARDRQWTNEGLPKVSVVAQRAKLPDLTRREIMRAAPGFNREG